VVVTLTDSANMATSYIAFPKPLTEHCFDGVFCHFEVATHYIPVCLDGKEYIGFVDGASELGEDTAASPQHMHVQEFLDRRL
jgi:hypothetical protein